jgi:hypothetical protein
MSATKFYLLAVACVLAILAGAALAQNTTTGGTGINSGVVGAAAVGGDTAAGATNVGNPVLIGCVNIPGTITSGQRANVGCDTKGNQTVVICTVNTTICTGITVPGFGVTLGDGVRVISAPHLWNGANYDTQLNNQNVTLLASGAQTATQTTADQTNYNGRCIKVVLDITAAGTGTITPEIDFKDPASSKYVALVTGTAQAGTGTTTLSVCPGMTVAANVSVSDFLPRTWRVKATKSDGSSWTFSIGAMLIN